MKKQQGPLRLGDEDDDEAASDAPLPKLPTPWIVGAHHQADGKSPASPPKRTHPQPPAPPRRSTALTSKMNTSGSAATRSGRGGGSQADPPIPGLPQVAREAAVLRRAPPSKGHRADSKHRTSRSSAFQAPPVGHTPNPSLCTSRGAGFPHPPAAGATAGEGGTHTPPPPELSGEFCLLGEVNTAGAHCHRRALSTPPSPRLVVRLELPAAEVARSQLRPTRARRLFDEMPEGLKATTASGEDRIGALPDEILQHVLSFLPSCQAVRTCVLARRWRHQWRSVPALRIYSDQFDTDQQLFKFASQLLLRRGHAPIHECEIVSSEEGDVWPWIRYALSCQARALRVDLVDGIDPWQLSNERFISDQLVRLELDDVELEARSLDFSSCPKLEVIKMNYCVVNAKKIVSQSVRDLSITFCTFDLKSRTRISAPRLVSLELADSFGWTPVLECMPSLVTAFVRLGDNCDDVCFDSYYGNCSGLSDRCECRVSVHSDDPVLLHGLSHATNLELITQPEVFIFRKDLKRRPSFSKLKTLFLNEWCAADNFCALVYFLQHSPILEKLTLELYKTPESMFETDGNCNLGQRPIASKHLQLVEVKYHEDEVLAL